MCGYVPDYMRRDSVADLLQLSKQVFFVRVEVLGLDQLFPPFGFDPGPHGLDRVKVGRGHRQE